MPISPILTTRLRDTLAHCGPFESNHELLNIFVDARIAPWRGAIPDAAYTRDERVNALIEALCDQTNNVGDNALVLFLHALADTENPENNCLRELIACADELEKEFTRNHQRSSSGANEGERISWRWVGISGGITSILYLIWARPLRCILDHRLNETLLGLLAILIPAIATPTVKAVKPAMRFTIWSAILGAIVVTVIGIFITLSLPPLSAEVCWPTPMPTFTITPILTFTPAPTVVPPTVLPTLTISFMPTPPTDTPRPTETFAPTSLPPTNTPSPTETPMPTNTPTLTNTPPPTSTPTPTNTPTPTPTNTPTPSPTPLPFQDEFNNGLTLWDSFKGWPTIDNGGLWLSGAEVQSKAEFNPGVILEGAISSSDWSIYEQNTDSSFGLEIWDTSNCRHSVTFTSNGRLCVRSFEGCDGGTTNLVNISSWELVKGSGGVTFTLTWRTNRIELVVSDGANTGYAYYEGVALPTRGLKIRLNAQNGQQYRIDYVRLRDQ